MLAKVLSVAVLGIDAYPVEVEVDVSRGLPSFSTVGLPDNAVKESKERVRSAIKNSGYTFPAKRITVNLAPADIKKEGTAFDLPVAVAMLKAEGLVKSESVADYFILGELSLDGTIKPVRGALPAAVSAKKLDKSLILPVQNSEEAALVDGVDVFGADTLSGLVEFLNGAREIRASNRSTLTISGRAPHLALDRVTPSTTTDGVREMSSSRLPAITRSRPVAFFVSSAISGLYLLKSVFISTTSATTTSPTTRTGRPIATIFTIFPMRITCLQAGRRPPPADRRTCR